MQATRNDASINDPRKCRETIVFPPIILDLASNGFSSI
jgi:hypothetical protein